MTVSLALPSLLPGQIRENGIDLPPDLSLDAWANAFAAAEFYDRASPWVLADLLVYGEDHFGEAHAAVLPTFEDDPTGARQERLKQARWMGRTWPPVTRVPGASYSHHRVVTKMAARDRGEAVGLLRAALDAKDADGAPRPWSTRELALEVKARESAISLRPNGSDDASCVADRPWTPTLDDLEPDWRPHVEAEARGSDEFIRGVLWAWKTAGNEAMFREGVFRD